ncbi:hypothetical protein FDH07_gp27 [Propionibacterium phage Anatole]|uniref:Uncharacterized protein n=3 Tax=Anatolevirus TaxID=2169651 RepID=A0A1D8ETA1_9CAUD|nr:hypothetical protein FDH07_gp27 [Propionibacterium phage Anatole]YP_009596891.1 hypothetical protein FDH09_gp27 [Propionibacterium phage B3]AOT24265.1 hypothetical protein ANATOLE_27 [Propionibacterium phage Anatole]AOT24320.1 hypothetical protein B3_27 [Propionibacterium phage B3]AOT24501.1 hypothetical protein E1_27 [Propionibacterium phage E1]
MKHLEGEANGRRHDQTYILPASMKALPKEGEAMGPVALEGALNQLVVNWLSNLTRRRGVRRWYRLIYA